MNPPTLCFAAVQSRLLDDDGTLVHPYLRKPILATTILSSAPSPLIHGYSTKLPSPQNKPRICWIRVRCHLFFFFAHGPVLKWTINIGVLLMKWAACSVCGWWWVSGRNWSAQWKEVETLCGGVVSSSDMIYGWDRHKEEWKITRVGEVKQKVI